MNQSKINARSVSIQCTLHQQPMRIAPDFLMLGFSSTKTFTLSSIPLTPCHSARSRRRGRRIHPARKYPFQGFVEGSSLKILLALRGNIFSTSKNPLPQGEGGPLAVGEGDDSIKVDQLFYRKCIPT